MNSLAMRTWARVVCIAHALVVTGLWYAIVMLDKDIVKVKTWTSLACLWPIWIVSIAFPDKAQRLRWFATLVAGLLLLSPTFSTLYSFVVWSSRGFAP